MIKKIIMPFGMSFCGVFMDVKKMFTGATKLMLVVMPDDEVSVKDDGKVSWNDRKDGSKEVETGMKVVVLRLPKAMDGFLDLAAETSVALEFAPDVAILNGGRTPQQGILWQMDCKKLDCQRDGALEIEPRPWKVTIRYTYDAGWEGVETAQEHREYGPFCSKEEAERQMKKEEESYHWDDAHIHR